ncbi:hypothetical protein P3395_26260, partial [Vibrio parahaemolyticus]|nr:hypothetical protein [Vibrio parahaemolyticus]
FTQAPGSAAGFDGNFYSGQTVQLLGVGITRGSMIQYYHNTEGMIQYYCYPMLSFEIILQCIAFFI